MTSEDKAREQFKAMTQSLVHQLMALGCSQEMLEESISWFVDAQGLPVHPEPQQVFYVLGALHRLLHYKYIELPKKSKIELVQ